MNCINKTRKILFPVFLVVFLFSSGVAFATTDLSVLEADITFSKQEPFDGDQIRIYARVFNTGDSDATGSVVFLLNNKEIGGAQPISVKTNTYDDVFIDWTAKKGNYDITAKITGVNPADENSGNNQAVKKDFFIDLDTDSDGTGDQNDSDADNDGLSNEEESNTGTSPTNPDTDNDGVNDGVDDFPLDNFEWHDADNDGVGDNSDLDADGDGISNEEEIKTYGTSPLNPDSDNDGIKDKQELENKTNPNKPDTDGDGVNDSEDAYPLDSSKWQASLLDSLKSFINSNPYGIYIITGIPAFLILLFLFFGKKKRKRRRS